MVNTRPAPAPATTGRRDQLPGPAPQPVVRATRARPARRWTATPVPAASVGPGLRRLAIVTASVALGIGLCVVIGYVTGSTAARRVVPGQTPVSFDGALVLVLVSLSLLAPRSRRPARWFAWATAILATAIAVVDLVRHASGSAAFVLVAGDHTRLTRMPILVAVLVLMLFAAALARGLPNRRVGETFAVLVLLVSALALLGLAYGIEDIFASPALSRISAASAIGFLLVSVATLADVPDGALGWALSGVDPGATLLRRLLPVAIVVLPLLGYLVASGQRQGWFSRGGGPALLVVTCAAVVATFSWAAARGIARVDRGRARAIAELTSLRIDLERQVEQRAEQLQRRHNEIAVLEDRQRIAADLHDIVIQRLFAAGMYLQSGSEDVDPATRTRLDAAVEAMDMAIKDLRASIFELGGRAAAPVDLATAIDDVCSESARVLGFRPDITIDDPDDEAGFAREDLLAVLREALANVARHADAARAHVTLRVEDGWLTLTVDDDGRGMPESVQRSSGTRNILDRARAHGGTSVWEDADEVARSGTRLVWRVPLPGRSQ